MRAPAGLSSMKRAHVKKQREHDAESDNVNFLLSNEQEELLLVLSGPFILNIVKTSLNPLHAGVSLAAMASLL